MRFFTHCTGLCSAWSDISILKQQDYYDTTAGLRFFCTNLKHMNIDQMSKEIILMTVVSSDLFTLYYINVQLPRYYKQRRETLIFGSDSSSRNAE